MRRQERYPDYFRGCLAGLACGDALGMPVETMTHEAIMQLNDGEGVTGLMDQVSLRHDDTKPKPAGTTTDDTQLAFSLTEALIDARGLDLGIIAKKLVADYRTDHFGWGGTTVRAAIGLAEYFDSGGKTGRSPLAYLQPPSGFDDKRCGNGVAMRIAPYGLWHSTNAHGIDDLAHHSYMIGRMTHDDPRASVAGAAMAAAVSHMLYHGSFLDRNSRFFRTAVLEAVRYAEGRFLNGKPAVSSRIEHAFAVAGSSELLRTEIGTGCYALESVPFAIATFLRHPTNYLAGVLEAVNAGGDTDTTAAMVGALIGTNVGITGIPAHVRRGVPAATVAVHLADSLHAMCSATAHPHS